MIRKWLQANLIMLCCISFFVFVTYVNPDIEFIISPWWMMMAPNAAFVFALIVMKFQKEEERNDL